MLGMLKALDSAASVMRDPKDILLMDLDNQGKWAILTGDQLDKVLDDNAHAKSFDLSQFQKHTEYCFTNYKCRLYYLI